MTALPLARAWSVFRVLRRASHARKLIRASAAAFDAGQRKRAADLLEQAGTVVEEIRTAIG